VEIKNLLKTSVAAGALLALAAPMASGSAEAGIKSQNSKVNLTVGGQIVRSLIYADDGEHSQLFQVDGRTTGTRVRYIVSGQLTESIKVGGLIEHDVGQSNDSFFFDNGVTSVTTTATASTGQVSNPTGNDVSGDSTGFGIRHHFVSFEHKSLGKLSIGQTNTASNGSMELGYAGSGSMTLGGATTLSGINFTTGANGAFTTSNAASHTSTFDGLSRDDVIRYDTPKFGGFGIATSMQDEGTFDVAVRYSGKFGGVSVKAAAHYANVEAGSASVGQQAGIMAAAKHTSGLSARIGYAGRAIQASGRTPRTLIGGVGYAAKLSSLGSTNFYFEYYGAEDTSVAGNDMDTYYVGVVQKLDSIGSEMGLVYGSHSLDDTANTDYNNIDTVMFQTKLNF
jgi:hypothetical protein